MNVIAVPGAVSERDAALIKSVVAGIVPELRSYFDDQNAKLLERIAELEARHPEKGDVGERGETGPSGRDGSDGKDGLGLAAAVIDRGGNLVVTLSDGTSRELGNVVGRDGSDGKDGDKGADGRDGIGLAGALIDKAGSLVVTLTNGETKDLGVVVGRDGRDGVDGKDGEPGRDGRDGERGEKGDRGEDGAPGRDGKDAYPGEAKGRYDPTAEYLARDVVGLNGAAFMAKRDNPGECPGDGWMLISQQGKRGDRGEKGERGEEGKQGKDGAQPVAFKFDAEHMNLLMVLDSGEALEADFAPIAEAIIQAIRGDE